MRHRVAHPIELQHPQAIHSRWLEKGSNAKEVTALGNKILGASSYDDSVCDLNNDGVI